MYGREELESQRICAYGGDSEMYEREEADSVMDAMEQQIDDECGNNQILSNVNESLRKRLYESNGKILKLEKELRETNKRIKELEAENARLKAQVPKWISVHSNPNHPLNKDFLVAWLGKSTDTEFKDMAIRHSVELTNDFTHWMQLPPPPPPTEESSATEKENG